MNGLFHKALGFGGVSLHIVVICFFGSCHLVFRPVGRIVGLPQGLDTEFSKKPTVNLGKDDVFVISFGVCWAAFAAWAASHIARYASSRGCFALAACPFMSQLFAFWASVIFPIACWMKFWLPQDSAGFLSSVCPRKDSRHLFLGLLLMKRSLSGKVEGCPFGQQALSSPANAA